MKACECFYHLYRLAKHAKEREPENCFVAADQDNRAVGYILCAENFTEWERHFQEDYFEPSDNPATKMMGPGTIDGLRNYAAEYPAHLHIDLEEEYQRQGLGTRLMDQLLAHLKAKGIGGVMLCAVADNEKGINFYHKYGFMELERTKQEIMMGKKLADPSDRTGEPANANEKGV